MGSGGRVTPTFKGWGCLSYLLGAKKPFCYLLGCSASKGPQQRCVFFFSMAIELKKKKMRGDNVLF